VNRRCNNDGLGGMPTLAVGMRNAENYRSMPTLFAGVAPVK
jgi:hypothetical protein